MPSRTMKTEQGQRKLVAEKSAKSPVWRSQGPQGSIPGLPVFLQPKLAISQPGDPYEQEADRVADQVMRMSVPTVQRQCAACEEEEAVMVSRKAEGTVAGEAPRSVHSTLRSSGQPLASSTRAFFEPRFGQDLSHVRVHTDQEAQQSARDVNALAYTVGSHVVFGAERYAPDTTDGQRLLAHELTHVVQQGIANHLLIQKDEATGAEKRETAGLRLVFYQSGSKDSGGFLAYAQKIADEVHAVKLPYGKCDNKGIGAIGCSSPENVLLRASDYADCMGLKVEQVHVVGHVAKDPPNCLAGGLTANAARSFFPTAKVVVHGCKGVGRFLAGRQSVFKYLPGAEVYVHGASAEAGGPLEFYKVTLDATGARPTEVKTKLDTVIGEGIGFSKEGISEWAMEHVQNIKMPPKGININVYYQWLSNPVFASEEVAAFARAVLSDEGVPAAFKKSAQAFLESWIVAPYTDD